MMQGMTPSARALVIAAWVGKAAVLAMLLFAATHTDYDRFDDTCHFVNWAMLLGALAVSLPRTLPEPAAPHKPGTSDRTWPIGLASSDVRGS